MASDRTAAKLGLLLMGLAFGLTALSGGLANVVLYWDPSPDGTNVEAYYVFSADQATGPWTCIGSTNGWNSTNWELQIQPCEKFFYVLASNFWGVSLPSNVAHTPPPATNTLTNVSIKRVP